MGSRSFLAACGSAFCFDVVSPRFLPIVVCGLL
jgi:hypothetical protein